MKGGELIFAKTNVTYDKLLTNLRNDALSK